MRHATYCPIKDFVVFFSILAIKQLYYESLEMRSSEAQLYYFDYFYHFGAL